MVLMEGLGYYWRGDRGKERLEGINGGVRVLLEGKGEIGGY